MDALGLDQSVISAFIQVVLIDLVMSGDNAIIIGMAVAGLPAENRTRIIFWGVAGATVLRMAFAAVTTELLQIIGLTLAAACCCCGSPGACIASCGQVAAGDRRAADASTPPKTPRQAMIQIIAADISMSLDNVLAVAGAARDHQGVLWFGLGLSVVLMAVASNFIARILDRHHWVAWIGFADHRLCRRRHDLGRHPRGCCRYAESVKPATSGPWPTSCGDPQALAPYATLPWASRGRLHAEAEAPTRSPFQRDRDRIIHSTAFRRLKHKTQVFVDHEGDHYRTRLTHSLEVAQIARTICRALRLDEDLAEAVALAHDLGHPPFGHAGEEALHAAMKPFGGFDHNAQTLRIVTKLEGRYAEFDGLNLTWETLEGIVKHNGPLLERRPRARPTCRRRSSNTAATTISSSTAMPGRGAGRGAGRRHRLQQPRHRRRAARRAVRARRSARAAAGRRDVRARSSGSIPASPSRA